MLPEIRVNPWYSTRDYRVSTSYIFSINANVGYSILYESLD